MPYVLYNFQNGRYYKSESLGLWFSAEREEADEFIAFLQGLATAFNQPDCTSQLEVRHVENLDSLGPEFDAADPVVEDVFPAGG